MAIQSTTFGYMYTMFLEYLDGKQHKFNTYTLTSSKELDCFLQQEPESNNTIVVEIPEVISYWIHHVTLRNKLDKPCGSNHQGKDSIRIFRELLQYWKSKSRSLTASCLCAPDAVPTCETQLVQTHATNAQLIPSNIWGIQCS